MLTVVPGDGPGHDGRKKESASLIDEIVREGARRMLAEALQAEVDAYIARFAKGRDENGRWLVVRNGYHPSREILTSAGAIEVTVPRVNDKRTGPADGYRESAESWADLLRDCASRGMPAPVLAAGDGALGFWNVLREVFPQATEGRCWFHKTANVPAALPKSAHPGVKTALAEFWGAEDKDHARAAVKAFEAAYGAKFPKAAAKITDDLDELLAFYGYPCEHWMHLRTTNPIESTVATVRHRTKVTKGPGSRVAGLATAFKLIESAQDRWRAVNAPHLVALVRAGAAFTGGKLIERPGESTLPAASAAA